MPLTLDLALQPFGTSAEPEPAVKDCTTCGETLPLEAFSPSKLGRLGRKSQCKACTREANREYQRQRRQDPAVREAGREHQREYNRQRRQDPAYREAQREYGREYMRQRMQDPAYREAKREAERQRRQDPETRELILAQDRQTEQRRRALKAAATVEPFILDDLYTAWDEAGLHACYWCDEDFTDSDPMHIDHLFPLSKGGEHTVDNLVPAHASCNLSKNAKDPYAFALERHPWLASRPDSLSATVAAPLTHGQVVDRLVSEDVTA